MPAFIQKDQSEILRRALQKLQEKTPITSIGPGSVARAITEVITTELGDLYNILDFNTSMGFLSTAQGRALDMMGSLYNLSRKQLSQVATIDASVGVFYFYLDAPYTATITIPSGTTITTDINNFVGQQMAYLTTDSVTIPVGRTRVYCGLRPAFTDSVFTAGAGTLISHNLGSPIGTTLKCTNAKPIPSQVGYESDESYRTRLTKAVRQAGGGTAEAMRFTALSIVGVRDATVRTASSGLGTFEMIIVPEQNNFRDSLLLTCGAALNIVRPIGVRMTIRSPEVVPTDINVTVIFRDLKNTDKPGNLRRVEVAVLRYLNTMLVGTPLVYNQLIQTMMEATDVIDDVIVTKLTAAGTEILRRNYTPKDDQQIIPGNIQITF